MYAKVFLCGFRVFVLLVLCYGSPLDPTKHRLTDLELNSWIRHYDIARYDHVSFISQHNRVKRGAGGANYPIRLDVRGHGRIFKLKLVPDPEVFSDDVIFESTAKPGFDISRNFAYTGTLEDDENTKVHGIITSNGLFEGTIHTPTDDFFVEPLSRYLNNTLPKEPNFHSILYRASDVEDPRPKIPCASQSLAESRNRVRQKRWLLEADAKLPFDDNNNGFFYTNRTRRPYGGFTIDQQIDEELEVGNRTNVDVSALIFKNVYKRATVDPKKTTCMLYLQADHQFFQKYGTEEACIEVMTRHVQRVNAIYSNTDFNQDGKKDNITFMVKRVKVHTLEALKDPMYRFPNNYGVEKFLELFSEEDYDAFCLAYMFTYRDFEMGTLGLAWTGDLKNAGGVCEKNGHYRGSMKSLNTGIVTLLNYGKHVPPAVSHVTMAHEIGHNFGSPHDPEQCTPGGEDGNFIMFARATSGDKKNNNRFSPCSLKSINPVLNYKARSAKGCFTEPKAAICGNGVVEDGEECDCGWEEDCRDQCCFPMRRYAPLDEPPCKLTPRSSCSPSQGPCCTPECRVKFGDKCRDDNGCRDESFCNGRDPQCPPSINKPNKTICNKEFVCFMGECTGSICLAYGLESCQCIPGKSDPKTKACELCCKLPGDTHPCVSSYEWNDMPYDIPDMYSKPGTPCNDYSGYCDVFQMCREVDPSGPLATLRKLLLSEESIASFRKWIVDYWYAVAAILVGIITLLVLSTKYLGKKPTVKSKSVTIMHSSTTEAVRLPPDGETGVTIHPGVRSKLPLKRKVRDGKIKRKLKRASGKNTAANNQDNITNNNVVVNSPKNNKSITRSSPKKKKTSKVSAAIAAGQPTRKKAVENAVMEIIHHAKVKKSAAQTLNNKSKPNKKKKPKEIIDYSSVQADVDGKKTENEMVHEPLTPEDAVGKVQNWLKSQYTLPKSKSTPAGLTAEKVLLPPQQRRAATNNNTNKRISRSEKTNKKSRSVGNIPSVENNSIKDKVRLQVVYKPPFKFSVKLKKPEKIVSAIVEPIAVVKKPPTVTARTGVVLVRKSEQNQICDQNNTVAASADAVKKPRGIIAVPGSGRSNSQVLKIKNTRSTNNISSSGAEQTKNFDNSKSSKSLEDVSYPIYDRPQDDIDSNIHTVQSDLEVLLSENDD